MNGVLIDVLNPFGIDGCFMIWVAGRWCVFRVTLNKTWCSEESPASNLSNLIYWFNKCLPFKSSVQQSPARRVIQGHRMMDFQAPAQKCASVWMYLVMNCISLFYSLDRCCNLTNVRTGAHLVGRHVLPGAPGINAGIQEVFRKYKPIKILNWNDSHCWFSSLIYEKPIYTALIGLPCLVAVAEPRVNNEGV